MTTSYSTVMLAAGAIRLAIARLAGDFPFHARVLERFRPIVAPAVETMGVTATASGILLLYNPEFVLGLSADMLGGVLLHEVHHVVLGHLALDPADFPDSWAFIAACEVSVNEFVRLPLPENLILLEQFPDLPTMESTVERYQRLVRVRLECRFPIWGVGGVSCSGGNSSAAPARVIDSHGIWIDDNADPAAVREAIVAILNDAAVEAGGVPEELRAAVNAIGRGTDGHVFILNAQRTGTLDWRHLLRRYVGRLREMQGSYAHPPRRFPELVGVVPGRRRQPRGSTVVAIIDTSGSVDGPALEEIDGELRRISRTRQVTVVEADCDVHRVYRYTGQLDYVQGRGGTDFRPALDRGFLTPLRPELLIYFTDGYGKAPVHKPGWPLVWCLIPGGEPPAPYGRVIKMSRLA